MSSRQMRRLQDLVDRATGLDASDDEEEEMAVPNTMRTKKNADRHHERKKGKKEREKKKKGAEAAATTTAAEEPSSTAKPTSTPPAVSSHHAEKTTKKSEKDGARNRSATAAATAAGSSSPTADDWEEVEDDDTNNSNNNREAGTKDGAAHKKKHTHGDEEAAAAQAEEEKKRKKEERRKLRQQQQRQMQAEEDALLDAVLASQADPQRAAGGVGVVSAGSPPSSPNAAGASPVSAGNEAGATFADADGSLQSFVMACDAQQLDTRLERIKMFGADAVEDVGDGRTPHHRADGRLRDTGSVSFFPAHRLHVKFVYSAFATPNRYRWIPYDSLGVYLTTDETHDSPGQTWRDYTLNCDSNAFQRALAQLGACQDRMGGVQDLVECLARNKVYHIPTLLQCVYTMEATGESTFASELLDVALYQVGVLLRRFALSGTWAHRRLPMMRGGNALVFQVLQRGVHAALKRGCLRTAFERTRCLLSLDPRDPCGMLLLLDYTALRAKRWVWLLEMRHRVLTSAGDSHGSTLERSLKALPNYAFSWALAKHFMEREERLQSDEARSSKVLRGMTVAQRDVLAATPPAEELLSFALTRFPHAAVRLVNALGGVEVVCGGNSNNSEDLPVSEHSVWFGDIVPRAEDEAGDGAVQQSRLAELFVARHEELWKLNECITLLRAAVHAFVYAPKRTDADATTAATSPLTRNSALLDPYAYVDLTQEAVLGASVAPIPADLLRPDPADFGLGVDGDDGAAPAVMDAAMAAEVLRMLRQNREHADVDAATQQYLQQLEAELVERVRGGHQAVGGAVAQPNDDHNNDASGDGGAAEELDWYDYDDEEAEDVEAQEWYSVASDDDRASDEGEGEADSHAHDEPQ